MAAFKTIQGMDFKGKRVLLRADLNVPVQDGKVTDASYVVSPRDSASGMATGKRQYAPVRITKEWGAASPQLSAMKPQYDVKKLKGNERLADGWTRISLANTDGLCGAAEASTVVKSKSNITNN